MCDEPAPFDPVPPGISSTSQSLNRRKIVTKSVPLDDENQMEKKLKHSASSLLLVGITSGSWKNFMIRFFWSLLMIFAFMLILYTGHILVILMVIAIQIVVFKEVIEIAREPYLYNKLPWFRTISWYFLMTTTYFLYGEVFIKYFKKIWILDAFLLPMANHHRFISFSLYILGLVIFVLNLKKGYYKFQFSLFAWTHMALLLVTFQSHLVIINIVEGLVWFILPVCLVICNDIAAYLFGFFLGRTPLIKVSPKKTWEGFIGALFTTMIFAFFLAGWLAKYPYLTQPMPSHTFENGSKEALSSTFEYRLYRLPPFIASLRKHLKLQANGNNDDYSMISIAPIQLHAIIFAIFSSVIAPFGGFFASGVKRAFKIKDFADSIPGHGGLTDRMDCQFLMGLFAYMYTTSFVFRGNHTMVGSVSLPTIESLLDTIIQHLRPSEQLELFESLKVYLQGQQLIPIN